MNHSLNTTLWSKVQITITVIRVFLQENSIIAIRFSMVKKSELLQEGKSLLVSLRTLGLKNVHQGNNVVSFLNCGQGLKRANEQKKVAQADIKEKPLRKYGQKDINTDLIVIHDEITHCTGCELHSERLASVSGRGEVRAKLLFVGGWLSMKEQEAYQSSIVFGVEEDVMLGKMTQAINLQTEDVFITNIIKCCLKEAKQPQVEHIKCCRSYLMRQINILKPEIICTMGLVPTRFLLNKKQSLSQLRGHFYPLAISNSLNIPVIPTYHPSYLLANPEMKKATWADLQTIQKQLES